MPGPWECSWLAAWDLARHDPEYEPMAECFNVSTVDPTSSGGVSPAHRELTITSGERDKVLRHI